MAGFLRCFSACLEAYQVAECMSRTLEGEQPMKVISYSSQRHTHFSLDGYVLKHKPWTPCLSFTLRNVLGVRLRILSLIKMYLIKLKSIVSLSTFVIKLS